MMTIESIRPPITVHTTTSGNVSESAIRLFTHGFLGNLRYLGEDQGRHIWTLPSETMPETTYTITHDSYDDTLTCTCPAGQHAVPCKHVRLLQFRQGWVVEE